MRAYNASLKGIARNLRAEHGGCYCMVSEKRREQMRAASARYRERNLDVAREKSRNYWKAHPDRLKAYNASPKGLSCRLRCIHGLSREQSETWAAILLNPGTRCAICGVPNYIVKVLREKGPWPKFFGRRHGAGSKPRLTLDHIQPGCNEGGFRPLCSGCNSLRGDNQFTDEEVLTQMRDKWAWLLAPRFLYWLNSTPGVGGRLHRSVRCAKRDAEYADGAIDQPSQPSPTSTT